MQGVAINSTRWKIIWIMKDLRDFSDFRDFWDISINIAAKYQGIWQHLSGWNPVCYYLRCC